MSTQSINPPNMIDPTDNLLTYNNLTPPIHFIQQQNVPIAPLQNVIKIPLASTNNVKMRPLLPNVIQQPSTSQTVLQNDMTTKKKTLERRYSFFLIFFF